jgi:UDP-arabinose 4-epimerase
VHAYNLGTGVGTTVNELVEAVGRVSGRRLPIAYGPRRAGDPPALVAAADKAERELGWVPMQSDIDGIIDTALAWYRSRM